MTPNRTYGLDRTRTPGAWIFAASCVPAPIVLMLFILATLAAAAVFGYADDLASSPPKAASADPPASPIISNPCGPAGLPKRDTSVYATSWNHGNGEGLQGFTSLPGRALFKLNPALGFSGRRVLPQRAAFSCSQPPVSPASPGSDAPNTGGRGLYQDDR